MRKSIQSLNTKKSPDEFGLVSEHLKHGMPILVPYLVTLYNDIIGKGDIPKAFKSGVLHPIHKKGKDPKSMDNYRGIAVLSVFGKLFETLLLLRLPELNHDQSDMQVGFTKGMTPTMAALLPSEADCDSKSQRKPLYLATLDTKKAFDVVDHTTLLNNIYEQGVNKKIWLIIQNLYSSLTAKIKWKNEIGESFKILQGVRQGGIISTHFYKVYVNGLMIEIRRNSLGNSLDIYMWAVQDVLTIFCWLWRTRRSCLWCWPLPVLIQGKKDIPSTPRRPTLCVNVALQRARKTKTDSGRWDQTSSNQRQKLLIWDS